ncbi:hypothetical protein SAMN05216464_106236 [Mucilaginibacter pineti]|uniref:Uncharacterized protein n=1 Tax=Mucilaginibacter pineti TaxID=1391627 RepID=A0A1G7D4G2_9SPHI|nr:hypothetical protein [Mucilaginibacter pineti]SDE46391.1 hypothetical protein SAMN05216464_106236 [Mucilaginibacter pineti]
MKKFLLLFALIFSGSLVFAQQIQRFNPDTIKTIVIDSAINIRSHKLNAQDFIDAVMADTGFYKAFQNMKNYAFTAENRIFTYDKKNKVDGKIYRKLLHSNAAGKHKIEFVAKQDSGSVYKKNGKYQLYTVEMFDFIFMNAYNSDFTKGEALPGSGGKNESYKDKLKTLIFTPGRKVKGIPFISSKTEIFSPDMREFYRYEFARGKYLDTIPVYRFKVITKPSTSDGDTMIKEMTTIFDERTFQILGRYIDMKFSNIFVDFNVQMDIELNNYQGELLPVKITYQGNWNIPFHKEERASFLIVHKDYRKE